MARTRPPPCYIVFFVILCPPADNNLGDSDLQTTIVEPYKRALHTFKRSLSAPSYLLNLLLNANNKGFISLRDDVDTSHPVRSHGELTGTVVFTDRLREIIQEFGLREIIDKFPQEERYSAKCLKELVGVLKQISVEFKVDTVRVLLNWQKDAKSQANARRLPEGEPEDEPAALANAPEPVAGPSTGPGPIRTPARMYSRFNPYETPGSNVVQRLRRSSTMPSTPSHCRSLNTMSALAPVQEIPPFRPIIHDDAMSIDDPDFFVGPLTPPPSDPRPSRRPIREFDDDDSGNAPAPPPHDDATCPVQPRFVELQEQQLESQARIGALEAANAALVQARDWTLQLVNMIKLSNEA